ncbi:zinc-binding dehydrogenase [Spirosoma sp. KCTC 42546]|uniref:zinc-binding dehydrogenase n=1 Tax=Spirosoma sp. KCTC 42546 TaxID=2520506 RepID=UPI00115C2854|nr:zinc-binding dehydrogenase [Spirosoma sp. KCTC 42546]QDK83443.1 zinc-binding dehydrogenase [Spirosoma sp. KCTC 42546]
MNAVYLGGTHQPVQLINAPIPTAGPGQVLVKLQAASLNHRDVFIQQGLYPGIKLPVILGSDGAGVVVDTGEGVDASWLGQAVVINPGMNWGGNPKFYGADFQILGMPTNGTFADYVVVGRNYIHHKPQHLTFEQAAALPLAGLTAWRALMTKAELNKSGSQPPEKVLITGVGGGAALFALQFAVAVGAEVWVTSGSDEKLEKARELGATGGVNYRQPDWHKLLLAKATEGQVGHPARGYFDVIIDSAGGPGFSRLIDVAAPGGRIAFFGGTTGTINDIIPPRVFFKQLSIFGTTMGTESEFTDMIKLISDQQIVPVLDEIFPLVATETAMRKMEAGKQFGKIILSIGN